MSAMDASTVRSGLLPPMVKGVAQVQLERWNTTIWAPSPPPLPDARLRAGQLACDFRLCARDDGPTKQCWNQNEFRITTPGGGGETRGPGGPSPILRPDGGRERSSAGTKKSSFRTSARTSADGAEAARMVARDPSARHPGSGNTDSGSFARGGVTTCTILRRRR